MRSCLLLLLGRTFLLFLLLMEGRLGALLPPRILYLEVLEAGLSHQLYTNQSIMYSPASFEDFEIRCKSEDRTDSVSYFWNMMDVSLSKADKDFDIEGGRLRFLQPNYGLFECFATNSQGTSYSAINLTKHKAAVDASAPGGLQLLQGPGDLVVPENSDIRFSCQIGGVPATRPVVFAWSFNTKAVRQEWRVEKVSDMQENLVIGRVTPDDVGTVGCLVSSDAVRLYQEGSIGIMELEAGAAEAEGSVEGGQREMSAARIVSNFGDDNGFIRVLEESSLSLSCEAEGVPQPSVSWDKNDGGGHQLLIAAAARSEDGSSRTCLAQNEAGTDTKTVRLAVYERSRMAEADDVKSNLYVILGSELRLSCEFHTDERWAAAQALSVSWQKDGGQLAEGRFTIEASVNSSLLRIASIEEADSGEYACHLTTPLDNATRHWSAEVVTPAAIGRFEPEERRLVLAGTMAELVCEAAGQPLPNVTWFFNDTKVEQQTAVSVGGGSLRLEAVTAAANAGLYRCEVRNEFGGEGRSVELAVTSPTTPLPESSGGRVERNAGESLELTCRAQIDPLLAPTASYHWARDGVEVGSSWLPGSSGQLLRVPYLLREHAGNYTCHVKTIIDEIQVRTRVEVRTQPPRILRHAAEVGQMAGGRVSLACTASGIPTPVIKFKFGADEYSGRPAEAGELLEADNSTTTTATTTTSMLDIRGLGPANEGEYICLAVNEYGSSQAATLLQVYARTQILKGPTDRVLESGDTVTMPCRVRADSRIAGSLEVTWQRNEVPLEATPGMTRLQVGRDSLTLSSLHKVDEAVYTCLAKTSHDQTSTSGRLTVLSEPPAFTSTARDIRVLEGRTTDLLCQASGIPAPRIQWSFGGKMLTSRGGVLSLGALTPDREGGYVCTASNVYGSIDETVNVQVIKGVRKETTQNLVPDIVKNIKDTINLPCDFKVDHRVEKETRVVWLKDGTELPIGGGGGRGGRFEMLANKSLVLRNIELADAGQYACKVITPLQEVESKISLIVSGESPEILNAFDKVAIHEGDTLSLNCVARGVPRPNIEWLLKDRPVSSQYLFHIETANAEFMETRVVIKKATKSQEGMYQCIARNNVGTVVKNSQVRIIRRTKVSILNEEGRSDMTIPGGQKLKLPCKVENDEMNRITKIGWTKNNRSIEVGGEDMVDFGMDGSITIFNVQKRHEGVYRCTVTTVKDEASADLALKVLVNAPVITRHTSDQLVFSGNSLSLECIATGIPEPEIRWTFNRTITKVVGPVFEVKNAIATDAGQYGCTAKNSIGETQRTIVLGVLTVPRLEDVYQAKKGAQLRLPCVASSERVSVLWMKDSKPMEMLEQEQVALDGDGGLLFKNLTEVNEAEYRCRVVMEGGRLERWTRVQIMPDIVTIGNTRLDIREGENFTLKCDVLPGVNAKRMWKKDGQLVFPETGSGLDILQQGGLLTVAATRPSHSGSWECVASTAWGQDTILYEVSVTSLRPSAAAGSSGGSSRGRPCAGREPPIISEIRSTSNTSVVLAWDVTEGFNASCYEEFMIFWWSREADSTHDNQTAELRHRRAVIAGLRPTVVYYFQVNLVRDRELRDYLYGQTKIHTMDYYLQTEEEAESSGSASSSSPKAVIIVVIIVFVILCSLLVLLYIKRDNLSQYIVEQRHQFGGGGAGGGGGTGGIGGKKKKTKNNAEFYEFSSKLVANPDFMASLAPQWPEPEPEPTEDRAFIQQQRRLSRRDSKTSITSSWSSLFNVVSNENLSAIEQDTGTYRGRSRKE